MVLSSYGLHMFANDIGYCFIFKRQCILLGHILDEFFDKSNTFLTHFMKTPTFSRLWLQLEEFLSLLSC